MAADVQRSLHLQAQVAVSVVAGAVVVVSSGSVLRQNRGGPLTQLDALVFSFQADS